MNRLSPVLLAVVCLLTACEASTPVSSPRAPAATALASRPAALVVDLGRASGPTRELVASALDFGDQRVCGTSPTRNVVLFNDDATGSRVISFVLVDAPFEITDVQDESGVTRTLPFTLPARKRLTFVLKFRPTQAGALSRTLSVFSDDPANGGRYDVALSGRGTGPRLELTPTSLALNLDPGDGGTPFQGTVLLRNAGSEPLASIQSRPLGADFGADGGQAALAVGESTSLRVTYAPSASSGPSSTDTLVLDSTDPCGPGQVTLSGTRTLQPVLAVDRGALAFPEQEVGSSSTPQTVTVRNEGGAPLTLSSVTVVPSSGSTSPFSVSPSAGFTLRPQEARTLAVRFTPAAVGTNQTATLQLTGNGVPASASVTLTGDAVASAPLELTPALVRFPKTLPGQTQHQSVVVRNTGTDAVTLAATTSATPAPSPFTVSPANFTLSAGASTTLDVVFTVPPNAAAGSWSGQLTLSSGASGASRQTSLSLFGETVRTWIIPTASLAFSSQVVGTAPQTRGLVLSNPSTMPVRVFEVSAGSLGPYTITGLPVDIPAGDSRSVTVSFSPTRRGAANVSLQLTSTATEPVPAVALSGQGLAPELSVPAASLNLNFGTRAPDTTTVQQVTLTNSGDATLTVVDIAPLDTANFRVDNLNPPRTVAAGGTLTFNVAFVPSSQGDKDTLLRFFVDGSGTPLASPQLHLTGRSTGPSVQFTPSTRLNFGAQRANDTAAVSMKVRVTNDPSATETLQILGVRLQDGTPGLSLGASAVGQRAAPGESLDVEVLFRPTLVGRGYTDTLAIEFQGLSTQTPRTQRLSVEGLGATSLLKVDPSELSFGAVEINSTKQLTITLTNEGQSKLQLRSITGLSGTYFTLGALNWPKDIPAGGTEQIIVTFLSNREDAVTENLVINSNATSPNVDGSGNTPVRLSGRGAAPRASFRRKSFLLGEVPIGQTSVVALRVTNVGSAPLRFDKPNPSAHFKVLDPSTGNWPVTIPADDTGATNFYDFQLSFQPDSETEVAESLTLTSNDAKETGVVTLTGTGTRPHLVVQPSLDFGEGDLGVEMTRVLAVSNTGKAPLLLSALSVPFPYCFVLPGGTQCVQTTPSGFSYSVARQRQLDLELRVTPTTENTVPKQLFLTSNEGASGGPASATQVVDLKVKGAGTLSLKANTLQFGYQGVDPSAAGVTQGVLLANTTSAELKVNQVVLRMVDPTSGMTLQVPDDFSVKSVLPLTVGANGSTSLEFTFSPRERPELARVAVAEIYTTKNSTTPFVLRLEGFAARPSLLVTRTDAQPFVDRIDFQQTLVDSPSRAIVLRLSNNLPTAQGPLTVSASLKGADAGMFSLSSTGLGTPIAPGRNVELAVQFTPRDGVRHYEATLSLATTDPNRRTFEVLLSGQGTSSVLSVSTTDLNFGTLLAGAQTSTLPLVLTNHSSQDFVLTALALAGDQSTHFSLGQAPWSGPTYAIKPGETYTLPVLFQPRPDVDSSAELRVSTQDPTLPLVRVQLRGSGRSSVFKGLRRTVDFGTQRLSEQKAPEVVSLLNESNKTVYVKGTLQGAQAGDFTFAPDAQSCRQGALGIELRTGESCPLQVSYSTTRITLSQATLVLGVTTGVSGDRDTEARIALSGEKVSSFMGVDPLEVDFGWVDIDETLEPRLITVTNQSSVATRVLLPEVNNLQDFTVEALEPGRKLPPAATTQLRVTFHPQGGGESTGELRLRLQGEQAADVTIALKGQVRAIGGEGGAHACGAMPGPFSFWGVLALMLSRWLRPRRAAPGQDETPDTRLPVVSR